MLAELTMAMCSSYCTSYQSMSGETVYANNVEASGMKRPCHGFASLSCDLRMTRRNLFVNGIGVSSRRGRQVVVASSPPTEDVAVAAEPLTKEDLVEYLASGCKPKEKWRCVF